MREILFRGKPISKLDYTKLEPIFPDILKNGFIYGSLVVIKDKYYITINIVCISQRNLINSKTATLIEVIPETVSQYTGLKDKNGNKIFEGDILREYHPEQDVIIEWSDGRFGFRRANKPKDCVYSTVRYMQNAMSGLKIIGNIYDNDNPELLEVEE